MNSLILSTLVFGTFGVAAVQAADSPMPPAGATLVGEFAATGVQIYECQEKDSVAQWIFKSPEATLVDPHGKQVATHFEGPTWKMNDGSSVVGEVVSKMSSGRKDSIPQLLLRVKTHQGKGLLSSAEYVTRVKTKAGLAPKEGCDTAHRDQQVRVPYSATYRFYTAEKKAVL